MANFLEHWGQATRKSCLSDVLVSVSGGGIKSFASSAGVLFSMAPSDIGITMCYNFHAVFCKKGKNLMAQVSASLPLVHLVPQLARLPGIYASEMGMRCAGGAVNIRNVKKS